jgi:hypothetical protein
VPLSLVYLLDVFGRYEYPKHPDKVNEKNVSLINSIGHVPGNIGEPKQGLGRDTEP